MHFAKPCREAVMETGPLRRMPADANMEEVAAAARAGVLAWPAPLPAYARPVGFHRFDG